MCVSRPAHALISASGKEKNKKKKFKENAYLRTSLRGQVPVLSSTCDSRRERDRLLDANNSIIETDGEGKFVSFKVVLGGTSLFKMNHQGPAGLDCLVCRIYWSTGAAEGLIMVDSGTCLRGEIPKQFFLCV